MADTNTDTDTDTDSGQVRSENETSVARYFRVAAIGVLAIGIGFTFSGVRNSGEMFLVSCVPGPDASQAASRCVTGENFYWIIEHLLPLVGGLLLLIAIMGIAGAKAGDSPT